MTRHDTTRHGTARHDTTRAFFIATSTHMTASVTSTPVHAETSQYWAKPLCAAHASASSRLTARLPARSALAPTSTLALSFFPFCSASFALGRQRCPFTRPRAHIVCSGVASCKSPS